jgi:hypothetical protein
MIIALVLSVASVTILTFFAGYRLAMHHNKLYALSLMAEGDSLEPIFAALDREYAYTDDLNKSFTEYLEEHER